MSSDVNLHFLCFCTHSLFPEITLDFPKYYGKLTLWDFGLPPFPQLSKVLISARNSNSNIKYMIWGECNIIIETVTSMNKVHDDMNFMVKYMIWGEVNITIDTENWAKISKSGKRRKSFFCNNFFKIVQKLIL